MSRWTIRYSPRPSRAPGEETPRQLRQFRPAGSAPNGFGAAVRGVGEPDPLPLLENLLACGRIGQAALDILDRFHHPGFSACEGEGVAAGDSAARERLASYLVHAPFSLTRLHYDRDTGIVTYDPRACSRSNPASAAPERFSPLDALTAFIPEREQQIVRYYGYYSNKARGLRRKQQGPARITPPQSALPETGQGDFPRHSRRAWARLIRKVYLADPLACPQCGGQLRIISFIDSPPVIEKILRHLDLWNPPDRSPPARGSRSLEPDADSDVQDRTSSV